MLKLRSIPYPKGLNHEKEGAKSCIMGTYLTPFSGAQTSTKKLGIDSNEELSLRKYPKL